MMMKSAPHRLMPRRQPRLREQLLVPLAHHDAPAIERQFVGEVLRVTGAYDLRARIVAQTPRRKQTEAKCDFRWRGGTQIISRRIRPSRTAASFPAVTSTASSSQSACVG